MPAFPSRPAPARAAARLAWLFDIDGTLLLTAGASREAFSGAVLDVFGVASDLSTVPFAGRTEPLILRDILTAIDRTLDPAAEEHFWNVVIARMPGVLQPGRGGLLPGVAGLLDHVEAETGWVPGLLTGNMTRMAEVKLRHYGVAHRFEFGAFGEEAADRDALAQLAARRIRRDYGLPPSHCLVVGDTVHDVACARAAGMRVAVVANGMGTREHLAGAAPDLLLEDLRDPRPLLELARAIESAALPG